MNQTNNSNVEDKVMSQIKSGRIKLRSKYIFLAEKLGLGSAVALTVLLAVLFFNLVLFYLRASDDLKYLSFGSRGLYAFLETFPYALTAVFVILVIVAAVVVKKSNFLYNRPFGGIAIGLVCFIVLAGGVLTFTSLGERIERHAFGPHPTGMIFRPFFDPGAMDRSNGVAGRIIEAKDNYINIQTPRGTVKVDLSKLESFPAQELKVGAFITAIGEKKGDVFESTRIRVLNVEDIPMVGRGVDRRFGPVGSSTRPSDSVLPPPCGADCFNQQ
jgi:hypothetical protein